MVTAHRRESFGQEFENICTAILKLAGRDDVQIVWPVHRNPNVARPAEALLSGHPNVMLIEPLEYLPFVDLMERAYLLITEAVEAGTVKLVGTDPAKIFEEAARLLDHRREYERMARLHNPYGDGTASLRIAKRLVAHLASPLRKTALT